MTLTELLADLDLLGCRLELSVTGWPRIIPPREMGEAVRGQVMNLLAECLRLKGEIVEHLADKCPLCDKIIACTEDAARQRDPAHCDRGGANACTDAHGVEHAYMERCPFKD